MNEVKLSDSRSEQEVNNRGEEKKFLQRKVGEKFDWCFGGSVNKSEKKK